VVWPRHDRRGGSVGAALGSPRPVSLGVDEAWPYIEKTWWEDPRDVPIGCPVPSAAQPPVASPLTWPRMESAAAAATDGTAVDAAAFADRLESHRPPSRLYVSF